MAKWAIHFGTATLLSVVNGSVHPRVGVDLKQAVVTYPAHTRTSSKAASTITPPTTTQSDNCIEVDSPFGTYALPGPWCESGLWSLHCLGTSDSVEEPGFDGAFPFDLDRSSGFDAEVVFYQSVGGRSDLDSAGYAVRLHATCRVDGIAPNVILKLGSPNDSGNHGTRADPDPETEMWLC